MDSIKLFEGVVLAYEKQDTAIVKALEFRAFTNFR